MKLEMKNKDDCTFDMISLGEIMLRFDPGDSRIRTARSFRVWEAAVNTTSQEDFANALE